MRPIIENDQLTLSQLADHIPGKPVYQTLRRWAITGAVGASGQRVKLKTVKLPGGLGSTLENYDDFLVQLNQ